MMSLSQSLQTFKLTGQSSVIPYLRALGINATDSSGHIRDIGQIMLDLSDKLSHMDVGQATAFGRALGFDPGTIQLLIRGRQAVQSMLAEQENLNKVNEKDAALAEKRQAAWAKLESAAVSLGRSIATWLTPALMKATDLLTQLAQWAGQHGDFLKALFVGLAGAAVALGGAFVAAHAGVAALTIGIGTAAIAISLLFQDWTTWVDGGKAKFGEFYDWLLAAWKNLEPTVKPILESLLKVWEDLWTGIKDGWKFVSSLLTGDATAIQNAFGKAVENIKKTFNDFIDYIKNLGGAMTSAFQSAFDGAFSWLSDRFNSIWQGLFGGGAGGSAGGGGGAGRGGEVGNPSLPSGKTSAKPGDIKTAMTFAMDQVRKEGVPEANLKYAAAALVGNAIGESNLIPTMRHDGGKGYGIYGAGGVRWTRMAQWLTANGYAQDSLEGQMRYMAHEAMTSYGPTKSALMGATASNVGHATVVTRQDFERPSIPRDPARLAGAAAALKAIDESTSPYGSVIGLRAAQQAAQGAKTGAKTDQEKATSNDNSRHSWIGTINVRTQATDAHQIADRIGDEVNRTLMIGNKNYGPI